MVWEQTLPLQSLLPTNHIRVIKFLVWHGRTKAASKFCVESTVTAADEWLHAFFYFNDEIPSDGDFEMSIGDYLTFEFSMIMQSREYLFEQGGQDDPSKKLEAI
jgi:hypothetical protein